MREPPADDPASPLPEPTQDVPAAAPPAPGAAGGDDPSARRRRMTRRRLAAGATFALVVASALGLARRQAVGHPTTLPRPGG